MQGHLARFGSQVNVSVNHITPAAEQMLQVVPMVPVKVPKRSQTFSPALCHISPDLLIHMLSGMHRANASPRRLNKKIPKLLYYFSAIGVNLTNAKRTSEKNLPGLFFFSIAGVQKASSESDLHSLSPALSAVTSFATEECQKNSLSSRTKRERDLSQFWNNYITSIEGVLGKTITCGMHEHSYFF